MNEGRKTEKDDAQDTESDAGDVAIDDDSRVIAAHGIGPIRVDVAAMERHVNVSSKFGFRETLQCFF